jgi:SAM-dependent methyltransferase
VSVEALNPSEPAGYAPFRESFDSVLCVNVLEYAKDPQAVLRSIHSVLVPGGNALILVPQSPALFSSIDKTMGHLHRFRERDLRKEIEASGLRVSEVRQVNKAGASAWWFFGKVLHRQKINKFTLKLFDKTVWILRHLDSVLPWKGLSLVVVATKNAD